MIAIEKARRAGLLQPQHWLPNIIAGVAVGVVALPLAMAFAIASGAKPEQGIYTAIVGGLIVSLFGGTRVQIAGPTGAFVVILATITAKYGVEGLQIATFMAGAMLLLLGAARMGNVIKFIPGPVIVGFTSGIAVIIWVGQWKDFFGLPAISGEHFHEKLWRLIVALPQLHIATTGLAVASLFLVLLAPRIVWLKRVPGPLVAMVIVTLMQAVFQFPGVATIGSAFGGIPRGLPEIHAPVITVARVVELIGPAFTIAMLGAIESLLSAVVADGMIGSKHDSDQELVGQGLANIVIPFLGGFAATGAIARTATNIRNGANSPISGIMHAVTLVCIVLLLAPLAVNIPLAALAAILFVVAYDMSDIRHFRRMVKRAPPADVVILVITFMLTILTDLVVAVNIGVILAMLHFFRRMTASVQTQRLSEKDLEMELRFYGKQSLPPGVMVYAIEGPFFFGAVENFENVLMQIHSTPRVLVIRLQRMPFIDITGLQTLEEVIKKWIKNGVNVILCGANERVKAKLEKAGILDMIGPENYADDFAAVLARSGTIVGHHSREMESHASS